MKWNFLLVFSSLFSSTVKGGGPPLLTYPVPDELVDKISKRFLDDGVKVNFFAKASPSLRTSSAYSEEEKELQINITTTSILKSLQNPEKYCRLRTAISKMSCDRSGTFVPLEMEVATDELTNQGSLYAGAYMFSYGTENKISIGTNYLLTAEEQQYVAGHEYWHFFWRVQNLANCTDADSERRERRFSDFKLTFSEMSSAPFNSENKAEFVEALEDGEQQLIKLREAVKKFYNKPTKILIDSDFKKIITCLEEEALTFYPVNKSDKRKSALLKLLNQLERVIQTNKNFYSEDKKTYEVSAALAFLDQYPKIRNYLFLKLENWYMKYTPELPMYQEYTYCIEAIAPARTSLSCKK